MKPFKDGRSQAYKYMGRVSGFLDSPGPLESFATQSRVLHSWFVAGWKYFASDCKLMFGRPKILLLKHSNR